MKTHTALGIGATGLLAAYSLMLRPKILKWGATDEEVNADFPGADIVPGGKRSATMAVTIDAPPARAWLYLIQMGLDRGGWYSWDNLDNWGHTSAERVHAEWQHIEKGQHLSSMPDGSEWWEVASIEPERLLALRASIDLKGRPFDSRGPRPRHYSDSTWSFLLKPLAQGRKTRLVVSGYWHLEPRWLQNVISIMPLEPAHWIMQMRQFQKIKEYCERDERVFEVQEADELMEETAV